MSNIREHIESANSVPAGKSRRRTTPKDQLHSQAGKLTVVGNLAADIKQTDPLVFWTVHHAKPYLVDLREFADGVQDQTRVMFAARRPLIEQIAPAFQARHAMSSPSTIDTVKDGLRKWWQLFDAIEADEQQNSPQVTLTKRLTSVLDLGGLHGSRAVQAGMSRNDFHSFVVLADITRHALGAKRPLHWKAPAKRNRKVAAVLPPEDIKAVYHAVKADWHNAIDRWAHADKLIAGPTQGGYSPGEGPNSINISNDVHRFSAEGDDERAHLASMQLDRCRMDENTLRAGIGLWRAAVTRLGHEDLVRDDLLVSAGDVSFPIKTVNISKIAEAMYPNGLDIRSAFFLCLSVGGLNPSVLLDLQLDLSGGLDIPEGLSGPKSSESARRHWVLQRCPFLVQSPIEDEYYIEGWKDRAKSWISRSYKWKQHQTPGPILTELILRTWPLRIALNRRLEIAVQALEAARENDAGADDLNEHQQRVLELTDAVRSVWIYRGMHRITWLSQSDYYTVQPGTSYLKVVTRRLNAGRRNKGQPEIAEMEPRRFRDAYANWALDFSGGEVLAVMVALDHRQISTTDGYLQNTVVRARVAKKYRTFSQALFSSLASGMLDPTHLALETRFAEKGSDERSLMAIRLVEYREAVKSRYGVGCRDPRRPSRLVDPAFEIDGVKFCTVHRCTLCHENAIITPEAFPGLTLRQAELEILQEHMPASSFVMSSFDAELQNVRTALLPLSEANPVHLSSTIELHKREILEGHRRVPGFTVRPA